MSHNPAVRDRWFKSSPRNHFSVDVNYQVYVLQNSVGRYYIGLSENVHQRLVQHNEGISQWTRYRGPWPLVWTSQPLKLSEARKLENHLKRQKGGVGFFKATGLSRHHVS